MSRVLSLISLSMLFAGAVAADEEAAPVIPPHLEARPDPQVPVARPYEELRIPEGNLPAIKNQALGGSADAAVRLAMYYLHVVGDTGKVEGYHWLEVAIENGSEDAKYTLGAELFTSQNKEEKLRGRYWLKRVIRECGEPYRSYAADWLKGS